MVDYLQLDSGVVVWVVHVIQLTLVDNSIFFFQMSSVGNARNHSVSHVQQALFNSMGVHVISTAAVTTTTRLVRCGGDAAHVQMDSTSDALAFIGDGVSGVVHVIDFALHVWNVLLLLFIHNDFARDGSVAIILGEAFVQINTIYVELFDLQHDLKQLASSI